ncbi:response regulator [bacterium]|nr:response regulator [bacterium]
MPRLLIIDDEPNVRYSLEKGLGSESLEVITAESGRAGIELARTARPDVAILDVRLPDMSGLDVFQQIQEFDPRLPVIMITAFARSETAIVAMRQGAFEYLLKPVDLPQLRDVVLRAIDLARLRNVPAVFEQSPDVDSGPQVDRIVGTSPAMQDVFKTIGRVAAQNVPVLILGESGTGKELVARAIYQHSHRSERPFLAINCAALPETLLESELFGHERGAFTGADRQRIGKFEQCHGGTLFLDEIGDMTPATQARVLRVLQDGRFERVGGNETVSTDVRIIAATNRDLDIMIAEGRFRSDLLYRLNTFTIRLPSLRDRIGDLPALVDWSVRVAARELNRAVPAVAPDALRQMAAHSWPGNIRELQSAVRYALVHAVGDVLTADCLPPEIRDATVTLPSSHDNGSEATERLDDVADLVRRLLAGHHPEIYRRVQQEIDRVVFSEVLAHVEGNQVQASELLGISRTTLRSRIEQLGIEFDGPRLNRR